MGIQGLLPFLKKASRQANIKDFKGCTVAIDSYCWLHKGAFSCADKLGTGQETTQWVLQVHIQKVIGPTCTCTLIKIVSLCCRYVYYCLKYVNHLISCGIKAVMVFDGCRLPSKQAVEKARREYVPFTQLLLTHLNEQLCNWQSMFQTQGNKQQQSQATAAWRQDCRGSWISAEIHWYYSQDGPRLNECNFDIYNILYLDFRKFYRLL